MLARSNAAARRQGISIEKQIRLKTNKQKNKTKIKDEKRY